MSVLKFLEQGTKKSLVEMIQLGFYPVKLFMY